MLPKVQRVDKALFSKVFRSGRTYPSLIMTLRVIVFPGTASRFSFVVSKAVSNKAVTRNLLRRRGYAAVSDIKELLVPGYVCLFFLKKGADKVKYEELKRDVGELLSKAGVLRK